jgi:hypothetical protein
LFLRKIIRSLATFEPALSSVWSTAHASLHQPLPSYSPPGAGCYITKLLNLLIASVESSLEPDWMVAHHARLFVRAARHRPAILCKTN